MNINLVPFLVLGALLAVSVIVMIVWRQSVARSEDDSLHVLHDSAVPNQVSIANKLDVLDKWGKILTVVTVVYLIVVGVLYVYQQWVRASNLGA